MSIEEISRFNQIEFHDSDIDELYYDFAGKTIKIVASVYNNTSEDYDSIAMLFKEIKSYETGAINLIEFAPIEINYVEASEKKEWVFFKFTLLVKLKVIELSFLCKTFEIGLSPGLYSQHLKIE